MGDFFTQNDHEIVLACISAEAGKTREAVVSVLPYYEKFTRVYTRTIDATVRLSTMP